MAVALVGGCVDMQREMGLRGPDLSKSTVIESYVGINKSELYLEMGAPDRVIDDGKGGEILIWERWSASRVNKFYEHIWVNMAGVVYHWKWRDDYLESGEDRNQYLQRTP